MVNSGLTLKAALERVLLENFSKVRTTRLPGKTHFIDETNLITLFLFSIVGRNLHTFEEVAIKTEPIKSMQLLKENHFYIMLGANRNIIMYFIHDKARIYIQNVLFLTFFIFRPLFFLQIAFLFRCQIGIIK